MENILSDPTVQSSNIDDNVQLKTQHRERLKISSQNENTDESRKETYNVSVKSVNGTKLPLDIDEYEKLLISSRKFYFNIGFQEYEIVI